MSQTMRGHATVLFRAKYPRVCGSAQQLKFQRTRVFTSRSVNPRRKGELIYQHIGCCVAL